MLRKNLLLYAYVALGAKVKEGYIAISAAKNHYSVHFFREEAIEELKELLPTNKFGKRCVNIKYGDQSVAIVRELVRKYFK